MVDLPAPERAVFEDVNRVRLRVWEWGDPSDPVVLLTHGAHDHGRMWDELAPRFAELGYHVRAVDTRGHGDSGPVSSGSMWSAATIDLAMLAQAAPGPVGLIGHSMGGGMALSTASTFPELVRWVVSIDGLGPPAEVFEMPQPAEYARQCLDAVDRLADRGPRVWPTTEAMVERRAAVNHRVPRPWIEHLVEHGSITVDGGWQFATDPAFNLDIPDDFTIEQLLADYRLVACPVLAIMATEPDTWSGLPDDDVTTRLAAMVDARAVVVPGTGHYVHLEAPDATFAAIVDFLDEVGAP